MSKWKCEICNSEFDNFQAQGFNHKIYCPLCYFKELNIRKDKEIERLSKEVTKYDEILCKRNNEVDRLYNIIDELEKWLNEEDEKMYQKNLSKDYVITFYSMVLYKLKELKEGK